MTININNTINNIDNNNNIFYIIEQVTTEQTYDLRHRILRPNQSIESIQWSTDNLNTTIHYAAIHKQSKQIIGVVTICYTILSTQHHDKQLYITSNDVLQQCTYQIRGMCVDNNYRNKGIASQLLHTVIEYLLSINVTGVWCNARINALKLYENAGFTVISDEFDISNVCLHRVMYKLLLT